jgi:hypothetical protein
VVDGTDPRRIYLRAFDKKTSDRAQFADDPKRRSRGSLPWAETLFGEALKMAARRQ